jgi:hypothetical protein
MMAGNIQRRSALNIVIKIRRGLSFKTVTVADAIGIAVPRAKRLLVIG